MNRIVKVLVAIFMFVSLLCCAHALSEKSGSCGDNVFWSLDEDSGILRISGSGSMTSHPWNDYSGDIFQVVIEDGVSSICYEAFKGCKSINSVSIPESVRSIGQLAFTSCTNLQTITIPSGVTRLVEWTFYNCPNLVAVYLPDNITEIQSRMADLCYSVRFYCSMDSATARQLGARDLWFSTPDNRNLMMEYKTNNGVETLWAKGGNNNAQTITIPEGVTDLDENAFLDYTSLISIDFPSTLKRIEDHAFDNCSQLKELILPQGFINRGSGRVCGDSFCSFGLSSLKKVRFPKGVYALIDYNRWGSCGDNAWFMFNTNGTITISGYGDMWDNESESPFIVYTYWKLRNGWLYDYYDSNATKVVIKDGITSVGDYAFCNSSRITNISLSSNITRLGKNSFSGLNQLTTISIPVSVKKLDTECFKGDSELTQIIIPMGAEEIGARAFMGCSKLSQITIPASINTLGARAFANCPKLTVLGDLDGLTDIDTNAFLQCSASTYYASIDSDGAKSLSKMGILFHDRRYSSYELLYTFDGDAETGLSLVDANKTMTTATIPEGITNIGEGAFVNSTSLRTVGFPTSLTNISETAFQNCSNLTAVELPQNLESIGSYAFSGCSKMTSITFDAKLNSTGAYAFSNCSGLSQITIWNPDISLGSYTFSSCGNLTKIIVPGNLSNNVDSTVFSSCGKLTTIEFASSVTGQMTVRYPALYSQIVNVIFDNDVTAIGASAFSDCSNLQNILFSDHLETISENAFKNCQSITTLTLPDSVTRVGKAAFYGCNAISTVRFSSGMTEISEQMFRNCNSLTKITIPENIVHIRKNAFYSCEGLTEVQFHSGINSIETNAFINCSNLNSIIIPGGFSGVADTAFTDCTELKTVSLTGDVTIEFGAVYPDLAPQIETVSVLNGADIIGENAFSGCAKLNKVILPEGISEIQQGAFSDCVKLTDVVIPESVESIGDSAFSGCRLISVMNLPGQITSIGENAFSNCTNLSELIIDGQAILVDDTAFESCNNLTGIRLLGNMCTELSTICPGIYTQITTVGIDDSVTIISDNAFAGCSGLISVALPESIESIGENAFLNCTGINELTVPGNLDDVDPSAFSGCVNLTNLVVKDDLTVILKNVYPSLYGQLTHLRITSDVCQIIRSAFRNCGNLQTITVDEDNTAFVIKDGVLFNFAQTTLVFCPNCFEGTYSIPAGTLSVNNYAFSNCNALEYINLPDSVNFIENYAFSSCNATLVMNCCTYADNWAQAQEWAHQLIHEWAIPVYTWDENHSHITAVRTCKRDNIHIETETVSVGSEKTKDPTCTINGETTYTSKEFENAAFEAQSIILADIPATGHNWDVTVYTWAEDNSIVNAKRVCLNDQTHIETEDSVVTTEIIIPPTCLEIGETKYTSANYDNEAFETQARTIKDIPALGHDLVHHDAQAPTCTAIGWDAYDTCSRCDYTTYVEKAALGHDLVHHDAQAPTCTAIGWDAYDTCSRCDYTTYVEKAALGHDLVHHDAQAPTCTAIGWDAYDTCSRCDYTTYVEKAALGHDLVHHDAQAPTCTAIGWDAYDTCSRCDYTTYVEKAAIGHDWNTAEYEWFDDKTTITATHTCKHDALHTETETVDVTAVIIAPDEETEGKVTYTSDGFTKQGFTVQIEVVSIPALKDMSVMRLPNMLVVIEEEAFCNLACEAIIIPEGCTTIGEKSFAGCTNLLYVKIPASVTSYPENAFEGCNENLVIDWAKE